MCGENFNDSDIPAIWRKREIAKALADERTLEDLEAQENDLRIDTWKEERLLN